MIALVISTLLSICLLFLLFPKVDAPLAHWLFTDPVHYPIFSSLLSISLFLGVALLYRELQIGKKLTSKRSYYQSLLFSLLILPVASPLPFVSVAAIGSFALGAMALLSIHRVDNASQTIQHVGIAIGVSVLLCPTLFWGAIIIAFMAIRLRHMSWRSGAVFILGVLFPFVFLTTFLLAFNWHDGSFSAFTSAISNVPDSPINKVYTWIPALAILAYTVIRPMGDNASIFVIPIREMELLQTQCIWCGSFIILGIFGLIPFHIAIVSAAIPASALMTLSLESATKWWMADLAVIILLSAILLR